MSSEPSFESAPETAGPRRWRRFRQVVGEEVPLLPPALLAAQAAMAVIPSGMGGRVRARLLRAGGVPIGAHSVVLGAIRFTGSSDPGAHVSVGAHVTINFGCIFDAAAEIVVGDHVGIGQQVILLTNEHGIGPPQRRLGPLRSRPVVIEEGAWLSTRVLVLPGVVIGRGAVVAAGAVVTRSVAPDTLVGGVPARPLRQLPTGAQEGVVGSPEGTLAPPSP